MNELNFYINNLNNYIWTACNIQINPTLAYSFPSFVTSFELVIYVSKL